jgi:hypothetical protein
MPLGFCSDPKSAVQAFNASPLKNIHADLAGAVRRQPYSAIGHRMLPVNKELEYSIVLDRHLLFARNPLERGRRQSKLAARPNNLSLEGLVRLQ